MIYGDESSLVKVIAILLDNAIKYSHSKSEITITSIKTKNTVKLQITDRGMGILPTDLPHIFERFYRADKSRSQDGYGLGLSIARSIITAHNGFIRVKSQIGRGTLFTVELPTLNSQSIPYS